MAPAPCRLLYRALVKALLSPPPSGSSGPGGRAGSGSWSHGALCAACRPCLTGLNNFCWAFLELALGALCAASMSASGALGPGPPRRPDPIPAKVRGRCLPSPRYPQCVSNLPQATSELSDIMLDSGSPLLARSPNGPVSSARTCGRIPTVLGLANEVVTDYPTTPSEKTTVPPPRPVARGFSPTPTAPRCLPFCMFRGTAPCPQSPFGGNLSSARRIR